MGLLSKIKVFKKYSTLVQHVLHVVVSAVLPPEA